MSGLYIGIDVGTSSARAGIFDARGTLLAQGRHAIALYRDGADIAEQSSDDIWQAVCRATTQAVASCPRPVDEIRGIGFDATCSLVVLGDAGQPLPVGEATAPGRNIIVWMDHRAKIQAQRINETGHPVLRYLGGVISPEMEPPKLLWLKENRPETFDRAWQFFDLADYLTYRATGALTRSLCTLSCKWTYLAHQDCWDESFFRSIGLECLVQEGFARIGTDVVSPGMPVGDGLSAQAALEMGLSAGTAVGAGLIDAHAGGVGTVGAAGDHGSVISRAAYVFGTSACLMASAPEPKFVPGVWGPYRSAMIPGLWLAEGGQSAAGAALDHLIQCHPARDTAIEAALQSGRPVLDYLADRTLKRAGAVSKAIELVKRFHVVPEFLGNRSPLADPDATGLIAGLTMANDIDDLAALYIAGLSGLGYGLRQILDTLDDQGFEIDTLVVSGGAARSELVRQILADSANIAVAIPETPEPVLLGAAILGALAAGDYDSMDDAMNAMSRISRTYEPVKGRLAQCHDERYRAFCTLQKFSHNLNHQNSQ